MSGAPYPIKEEEPLVFSFISEGPKGVIQKVILYQKVKDNFYNLAFGDRDLQTGEINDEVVSDNRDLMKIMTTVIATVDIFFENKQGAILQFKGSNDVRTRFYNRIVRTNFDEFSKKYSFHGLVDGWYEKFEQNKNYEAIFVTKK